LKDGKINGIGIFKFKNGDEYNGEWKNRTKHGKGFFKFKNGDVYNGGWKDDNKKSLMIGIKCECIIRITEIILTKILFVFCVERIGEEDHENPRVIINNNEFNIKPSEPIAPMAPMDSVNFRA
jgi:hypothetical protein